jgi:glycosyltransferase involved in cell wall biosynthesis
MKKILMVTAFVPCNKTAGQNYTLQLIDDLSNDYIVDICYFKYSIDEPYISSSVNVRVINIFTISTVNKFMSALKVSFFHPFFTCRFFFKLAYFLYIRRRDYDYFYFDFSQTFLYALFVGKARKYLMAHDIVTQKYLRKSGIINTINLLFSRFSERFLLRNANATILCFSEKDRNLIKEYFDLESNKVDFFINKQIKQIDYECVQLNGNFVFFGAWGRTENAEGLEWFIENVMPQLDKNIRIEIIGSGIGARLKSKINTYSNINMLGFVENPYPILAASLGLIAPLFQGAGVKVKVIESLACGTPVIGTKVAFEGIDIIDDKYQLECEEPSDYVKAIHRFMDINIAQKSQLRNNFTSKYPKDTFKGILN